VAHHWPARNTGNKHLDKHRSVVRALDKGVHFGHSAQVSTEEVDRSFGPSIVLADSEDGVVRIGPLTVDRESIFRGEDGAFHFLVGPISVIEPDGTTWTRDSANGIDSLRLARLRDDLAALEKSRVGSIHIGDHDYFEILTLVADDDRVQVTFTHPSLAVWDHPVATFPWDRVPAIIEHINNVERTFGPLTGCCGACGTPALTYSSTPRVVLREFIAAYDDGIDVMRAVVFAPSEAQLTAQYPELVITRPAQHDLLDAAYQALDHVRLDAAPTGILGAVIANRASAEPAGENADVGVDP
jgi:hypothetical protein